MADLGDLRINKDILVPAWELSEAFVRASGPGGQNVNKVASAVQLTWSVDASSLPRVIKERFKRLYASRITTDGRIIVEAKEHRGQMRNRVAARDRLADMIRTATRKPKRRIPTRPTRGSVRRRLAAKKRRGEIKALRGDVKPGDY